ncbi:MAG: reverse transcriptase domain-containing protein [Gemmatales bacterium]
MYGRFALQSRLARFRHVRPASIESHRSNVAALLRQHKADVQSLVESRTDQNQFYAKLHDRIADYRMLRSAWDWLSTYGGKSPGPNGLTYEDIEEPNLSLLLRELSKSLKQEKYSSRPGRRFPVSKGPGRGYRILERQNIEDRVVSKAILLVIGPLLDHQFLPCSWGFRPHLDREDALNQAFSFARQENRQVWVGEDISNAYPSIPRNRLLDVVASYLPNPKVVNLIRHCLQNNSDMHGISQGAPLSPLLLNLYLHHFLDRHWVQRYPNIPLIRYVDDILLLCRCQSEAEEAHMALSELLGPSNMHLKKGRCDSIVDLRENRPIDWLGYQIRFQAELEQLHVGVSSEGWHDLAARLELCHTKPFASLCTTRLITGWIDQAGACYEAPPGGPALIRRIRTIAEERGFQEIPTEFELLARWQRAHQRWVNKNRGI